MSTPIAQTVFRTPDHIFVACPYCFMVHQHGTGGAAPTVDVSGNFLQSECMSGEYRVKGMFDFRLAHLALTRRQLDVERKRAARASAAKARERAAGAPKADSPTQN